MIRRSSLIVAFIIALATEVGLGIPSFTRPLLDDTQLLSTAEVNALEQVLEQMQATGKVTPAIYITRTLDGGTVEEKAEKTFRKWALGTKGKDEGVLFLIAPDERKMRLEVGYGLEGELTDVFSKRLLDNEVRPFFKDRRYADGILHALLMIAQKLDIHLTVLPPERPSAWKKIIRNSNVHKVAWIMLVPAALICLLGFFDAGNRNIKAYLKALALYLFLSLFLGLFFFVGFEEKKYLFLFFPGIFYLLFFIFPILIMVFKFLFPRTFDRFDKFLTAEEAARSRVSGKSSSRGFGGGFSTWTSSSRSSSGGSFSSGGSSGGGGASSSW